ncbi:hypothetical protein BGZ63DRAFT_87999 [Mariannaea sp. PMI_226]|nr:hypothetical protein BGZ63DRAFT_87999 [Mariannaea sp. PMI_226]
MSPSPSGFPPIASITIFPKPNHDDWHADEELSPLAGYGRLAFDVFVTENWDDAAPRDQDREQWERLVRKYFALGQRGREPYNRMSEAAQAQTRGPGYGFDERELPKMPAQAQIDRILLPYQTIQERNVCAKNGRVTPSVVIWLRICYLPELEQAYHDMAAMAEVGGNEQTTVYVVDDNHIFDNKELYDFGCEWTRILSRVPELGSGYGICWPKDEDEWTIWDERMEERQADGDLTLEPFPKTPDQWPRNVIYVVDEESLREGLVKIKWLNQFGECVWENKAGPASMHSMLGAMLDGCISDYVEGAEKGGILL